MKTLLRPRAGRCDCIAGAQAHNITYYCVCYKPGEVAAVASLEGFVAYDAA